VLRVAAMAKDKPFNNPFGALKAQAKPEKPQPPAPAPAAAAAKREVKQVSVDEESALFLSAMGAFEPVKPVSEAAAPPAVVAARQQQAAADEVESLLELAELVSADGELVVEQTGASVVGCAKGFDARLLGRLPAAAQLDVQTLARDAARAALERFIIDAHVKGLRSVRVVTGPALRQGAIEALTRGKLMRKVLAFSGGVDALDVLLRR
jgi:DNA-nicking Smr family endonuclease